MYKKIEFKSEGEWLKARQEHRGIGGTSASAIVGCNPYKTKIELVKSIKLSKHLGIKKKETINQKYGKDMEELIFKIAQLNFLGENIVMQRETNNLFINTNFDFMQASLDGTMEVKGKNAWDLPIGAKGILEIKTREINKKDDLLEWENRLPNNYLVQVLHYLLVKDDTSFAFLVAKLRYNEFNSEEHFTFNKEEIRYYFIKREDFKERLDWLLKKEKDFYEDYIIGNKIPEF